MPPLYAATDIITDIKMPGIGGLEMIKKIKDTEPEINFIVLSGYDDFHLAKKAFQYGAIDYILKPVDFEQLDTVLKKVIEKSYKDNREKEEKVKWETTFTSRHTKLLKWWGIPTPIISAAFLKRP